MELQQNMRREKYSTILDNIQKTQSSIRQNIQIVNPYKLNPKSFTKEYMFQTTTDYEVT